MTLDKLDETTGEVVLSGPWGEHGLADEARFQSLYDIEVFLNDINLLEAQDFEGEHVYSDKIEEPRIVNLVLRDSIIPDLLKDSSLPDIDNRFFNYRDLGSDIIPVQTRLELITANDELITFLSKHPKLVYDINPRKFEEVVAEIFKDMGFEVIITPKTRDGGNDIRAIRKDTIGTLLFLIECKRYAPNRPVGIEVVRSLYGVTMAEQANCGIVATTSYFSKDAKEFASKVKYHLSLRDYNAIKGWIKNYCSK